MTARRSLRPATLLRRLRRESGAVVVEFAIVISLFTFLFLGMLDFGRLIYSVSLAEKAAYLAVRTAIVRPPACAGVPDRHTAGTVPAGTTAPRFGTSCRAASYVCASVATVSCAGDANNATASEVWNAVAALLPVGTNISVLQFTYEFDSNLGFLGGPYTPMVTVELNMPNFQFVSPLGALANASGASGSTLGGSRVYQTPSASLPAEDLNLGDNG